MEKCSSDCSIFTLRNEIRYGFINIGFFNTFFFYYNKKHVFTLIESVLKYPLWKLTVLHINEPKIHLFKPFSIRIHLFVHRILICLFLIFNFTKKVKVKILLYEKKIKTFKPNSPLLINQNSPLCTPKFNLSFLNF